jgi:hypothetical protein
MEDSFESLREDRVRAWLRAENKGMKALTSLQIPASIFDNAIREAWMSAVARRKAAWEARAVASTSGCTNHFAGEWVTDNADTSSSSASGSGGGGLVIDDSSGDEGDV